MSTSTFAHDTPAALEDYDALYRCGPFYDFAVYIAKVGGGTIGRRYVGAWHYAVIDYRPGTNYGQEIGRGSDFACGSALTHRQAAEEIAGFFLR